MAEHNPRWQRSRRRHLRTEGTSAEATLWTALKARRLGGFRWRRQFGIGPYIVDFYCPAARLVVELDGAVHDAPEARQYDDARTRFLRADGVRVLRFENRVVFEDPEGVKATILQAAQGRADPGASS